PPKNACASGSTIRNRLNELPHESGGVGAESAGGGEKLRCSRRHATPRSGRPWHRAVYPWVVGRWQTPQPCAPTGTAFVGADSPASAREWSGAVLISRRGTGCGRWWGRG